MDIVFGPDGNFDEVYLYEELMEADLHAIVRLLSSPSLSVLSHVRTGISDPLWSTPFRCPLPVIHLPDALRSEVHPLGRRAASRPQTGQSPRERGLRTQDMRFWSRAWIQSVPKAGLYDRVCRDAVVPRA